MSNKRKDRTIFTIELNTEQRNTVLAALEYYQYCGMGEPANRPEWLHDIACPEPGGTTSLDDGGIHELRLRISGDKPVSLAEMADRARLRDALYFVVPSPGHASVVTYHDGIQDADDCACQVRGKVYTAKAKKDYCVCIDRTGYEG